MNSILPPPGHCNFRSVTRENNSSSPSEVLDQKHNLYFKKLTIKNKNVKITFSFRKSHTKPITDGKIKNIMPTRQQTMS